jgi:hypothetical protein
MALSKRYKDILLSVIATDMANVHEIDEQGRPLMEFRIVGKAGRQVIPEGVKVPYHAHYIARLKEGSLLPADIETARLAGVPFVQSMKEKPMVIEKKETFKSQKDE